MLLTNASYMNCTKINVDYVKLKSQLLRRIEYKIKDTNTRNIFHSFFNFSFIATKNTNIYHIKIYEH